MKIRIILISMLVLSLLCGIGYCQDDIVSEDVLTDAIEAKNMRTIRELIQCDRSLVNTMNSKKLYPLHVAVKVNSLGIVEFLLLKGAKINCFDRFNKTPMDYAAGNQEMTAFLKSKGGVAFYSEQRARQVEELKKQKNSLSSQKKETPKIIIEHVQYVTVDTEHIRTTATVKNTGRGSAKNLSIMCCFCDQFDKVYSKDSCYIGSFNPGESKQITFFSLMPGNIRNLGNTGSLMVVVNATMVSLRSRFIVSCNGKAEIYR